MSTKYIERVKDMIAILKKIKKTNSTDFYKEYDLTAATVKSLLLLNGFNPKYNGFVLELATEMIILAEYNLKISQKKEEPIFLLNVVDSVKSTGKSTVNDLSWNIMIDDIIAKLSKNV